MGRVVVLGEAAEVETYALAGAEVVVADDPESAVRAWSETAGTVTLLVLTCRSAAALAEVFPSPGVLTVVMPP